METGSGVAHILEKGSGKFIAVSFCLDFVGGERRYFEGHQKYR